MRIKDHTDMVRHLTDPFNIPEARRMIAENPALTQEQFKAGGIVEPRVGFYKGELVKIKPGLFQRKDSKTYRVIQQRGGGERLDVSKKTRKEAEKVLADYIEKNPAAKQVVPEGADKFLKTYLKDRGWKSWEKMTKGQKSNFIELWPAVQKQQALIKGMIPESEMAERLGISKEKLANLRKNITRTDAAPGSRVFHQKLVELVGKPVNLGSVAGGFRTNRGENVYYNPIKSKDLKLVQRYLPQESGFISHDVTQRIKTLADDDWFMNRLKKVTSVDDFSKMLPLQTVKAKFPKLKLTDSKLSKAVVYLGQVMQGHVEYRGLEDIGLNKVVGNRISRMIEDAPFGNFFKKEAYNIAMSNIDRQFGHEVGTFNDYKNKIKAEFRRLGFKDFKKFNLDEYVGTSIGGWKKSGQFSVFTRLLEKNVNQKSGASYLGRLSQATDALEAAIAKDTTKGWKEAEKIVEANKADALRTIKKTKNTMPYLSLSNPGAKTNFGVKRLNQLEAQGLDLKSFFRKRHYTYSGLGDAFTQREVLSTLEKGETGSLKGWKPTEKGFNNLIENIGCPGKAAGGRVGFAETGSANCFNLGREKIRTGQIKAGAEESNFKKLIKAAKGARGVARVTGLGLAWEAAFAPIIVGWMGSQGESWERMKHELAYGPILEALGVPAKYVPGESAEEELTKHMGKDAFDLSKIYEMYGKQEMVPAWDPSGKAERFQYTPGEFYFLKAEEADEIYKSSRIGGEGYETQSLKQIRDKIKKREQEVIPLIGSFYEGPAGQHFAWDKRETAEEDLKKGLAELEADKKAKIAERQERGLLAAEDWTKNFDYRGYRDGGIVSLLKK